MFEDIKASANTSFIFRTHNNYLKQVTTCTLTVHPRMSCLLISAPCSNSFSQTLTLPSFAAYINGDMRYLGQSQKETLHNT